MNFLKGNLVENGGLNFQNEMINFHIPDSMAASLKGKGLNEVILGIRPEHFLDINLAGNKKISESQKFTVDVIEPVGNEVFVYLKSDSASFCMRMPPERLYNRGETVSIAFDLDKLYFFDPANEERLA